MNHVPHSYSAALANEIEKQIEEAAQMGEPPSFALRRDQADWLVSYLKNAAPQAGSALPTGPGSRSSPAVAAPTPRTDAFAKERLGGPAQTARYRTDTEWRAFARELERELNNMRPSGPLVPVEIRLNDDKTLDEVVAKNAQFHLEQMDFNHWWMDVEVGDKSVSVWLHSKTTIRASYERRDYSRQPATDGGNK